MAALVGLGSAALVFFVLDRSAQAECYRQNVEIPIAYSEKNLTGCPFDAFDYVRQQISEQRNRLAANDRFVPDEPDPVQGKATLVVWIALLSGTAGLAGVSAVRSTYMIALDMKPRWGLSRISIVGSGMLALVILLLPYLLIREAGNLPLSGYEYFLGPSFSG